jgi:excisionase family DNA binding protein
MRAILKLIQMKQMKQMEHSKKWLTVKDIADYCMVDRVTVRRWIHDDKLSSMKLPSGHYRITFVDFREFLGRWQMPVEDWLLASESKKEGGD